MFYKFLKYITFTFFIKPFIYLVFGVNVSGADNLPKVNSYGIVGYTPRELIEDFGENIPQRIALGVMKRFSRAVKKVYLHQTKCVKFHKFNL